MLAFTDVNEALRVLNRSHGVQKKSTAFPLKDLARVLAFTDENEALRVLNRSHSVQRKFTAFPLKDLARMLAFTDENEAAAFCAHFDLQLTEDEVHFARSMSAGIKLQEKALPPKKSVPLVLSKNSKCLGEVVNSGPLPPVYRHTPHCSFTTSSTDLTDTGHVTPPKAASPQPPPYSNQDVQDAMEELVEELVEGEMAEQNRAMVEEILVKERKLEKEMEARVRGVVCAGAVLDEVARQLQELVQEAVKEEEEVRASVCAGMVEELCEQVMTESVQQECRSSVLDAHVLAVLEKELMVEGVDHVVVATVQAVVKEELQNAKKRKVRRLETLKDRFLLFHTVKGCWNRWREALQMRHHIQDCAEAMPPCPPFLTLTEQLDILLPPHRRKHLNRSGIRDINKSLLERSRVEGERRWSALFSSLELPVLLRDQILMSRTPSPCPSPPPDIYWKLLLLSPRVADLPPGAQNDLTWIYSKLRSPSSTSDPCSPTLQDLPAAHPVALLSKSFLPLPPLPVGGMQETASDAGAEGRWAGRQLYMAVQWITPDVCALGMDGRREAVLGTCAVVMFVCVPTRDDIPAEVYITSQLDLLLDLLGVSRYRSTAPIPLLVMYSPDLEQEEYLAFWCASRAAFERSCQTRPISDVLWLKLDFHSEGRTPEIMESELIGGLRDLASSSPPQPSLVHTPLTDYLEYGLNKYFDPVVIADGQQRAVAGLPSQPPGALVKLFNSVLAHLSASTSREELMALQWPLPEFAPPHSKFSPPGDLPPVHWNSPAYLARVRDFLASLSLPDDDRDFPDVGGDWEEMTAGCLSYVNSLLRMHPVVGTSNQSSLLVLSRVNALLHQTWKAARGLPALIPWDRVILVCVREIVTSLHSDLWVARLWNDSNSQDDFKALKWYCASTDAAITSDHSWMTPRSRFKRHRHVSDSHTTFPASPAPLSLGASLSQSGKEERKRQRLEESELKTKKLVKSYEEQLEQWLASPGPIVSPPSALRMEDSEDLDYPDEVDGSGSGKEVSFSEKFDCFSKEVRTANRQAALDAVLLRSLYSGGTLHK